MTSQAVEGTWICTGGYGRFRGEWVDNMYIMASNLTDNSQRLQDDIININSLSSLSPSTHHIHSHPYRTWESSGPGRYWHNIDMESVPRESGNYVKHACKILNTNNDLLRVTFATFYAIKSHLMVGNLEDLSLSLLTETSICLQILSKRAKFA